MAAADEVSGASRAREPCPGAGAAAALLRLCAAATARLALGGLLLKAAWKCRYPFTAGVPPVKHEAREMPLGQVGLEANKK